MLTLRILLAAPPAGRVGRAADRGENRPPCGTLTARDRL